MGNKKIFVFKRKLVKVDFSTAKVPMKIQYMPVLSYLACAWNVVVMHRKTLIHAIKQAKKNALAFPLAEREIFKCTVGGGLSEERNKKDLPNKNTSFFTVCCFEQL